MSLWKRKSILKKQYIFLVALRRPRTNKFINRKSKGNIEILYFGPLIWFGDCNSSYLRSKKRFVLVGFY